MVPSKLKLVSKTTFCEREKGENHKNCPEDCVSEKNGGGILEILKKTKKFMDYFTPPYSRRLNRSKSSYVKI